MRRLFLVILLLWSTATAYAVGRTRPEPASPSLRAVTASVHPPSSAREPTTAPSTIAAADTLAVPTVSTLIGSGSTTSTTATGTSTTSTSAPATTSTTGVPSTDGPGPAAGPSSCAGPAVRRVDVVDSRGLQAALDAAEPGDVIQLTDGIYTGRFTADRSGTAERRIRLCGTSAAVLRVGTVQLGTVLQLGASYWDLSGFTVTTGLTGIAVVRGSWNVLDGLTVFNTGHEAIKLRTFSTDNRVVRTSIHTTGKADRRFGEGIYVGSAQNNWCEFSDCKIDRSDRNVLEANSISDTSAEAIDVKEGTTGGTIVGNRFDGTGSSALSWVDVKGNEWSIGDNQGVVSPGDGFRTDVAIEGWGKRNVFSRNVADARSSGYGFRVTAQNVVRCDNSAPTAGAGLANVACSSA